LRLAGGAGPAALERRAGEAALDHLQGGDELTGEQIAAAAFIGKAGKRVEQVEIAHDAAIARLLAPDGDHHRGIDAVAATDRVDLRCVGGEAAAAAADQRRRDVAGEKRREGRVAIAARWATRLLAVELDRARGESERREDAVDRLLPHPFGKRAPAQVRQIVLEALLAEAGRLGERFGRARVRGGRPGMLRGARGRRRRRLRRAAPAGQRHRGEDRDQEGQGLQQHRFTSSLFLCHGWPII
jgi:hypothetical protein